MALENYLRDRLKHKNILLMTHIVLGYPSLEESFNIVQSMVKAGVDLVELQIPFSEPIADGPVILRANQRALASGVRVKACLKLAKDMAKSFDIPFLYMTYYNIIFRYGVSRFIAEMKKDGLQGAIIPDLPPEEGGEYIKAMANHELAPIFIFSPTTNDSRMRYIASSGKGFIYCVARKGVTGSETKFSENVGAYLARCRQATALPLALGFGVKSKDDLDFLKGKADIAVIGTETIRVVEREGVGAVGGFIQGLVS
ncbi:MAG: tryptophan synthase subunit alpha [Pseudomonadota bacterium]